jgi:hypothetical protein
VPKTTLLVAIIVVLVMVKITILPGIVDCMRICNVVPVFSFSRPVPIEGNKPAVKGKVTSSAPDPEPASVKVTDTFTVT